MSEKSKLISPDCLEAMLDSALRILQETGIETSRKDLLKKVSGKPGLIIKNSRIFVEPDAVKEVIALCKHAKTSMEPGLLHPTIHVSDRATLFADHHARKLRPLLRADVVCGTRLLEALNDRWVAGTTSGTPQDIPGPLQAIEQYVIGYRYSRNGGSTCVPLHGETAKIMYKIREIAEGFNPSNRAFHLWVPSPLRLDATELDELLDSGAEASSFLVGSMPIMGLTGPVDPLGIYTLSLAETLGGATILHRLCPNAQPCIYPHPQPMDPRSGLIAFGTPEWNLLELMQKDVMEYLGMRPHQKDNLTSSCMPDMRAQSDKTASVALGLAHGFTTFNMFPLCVDEVWSDAQLVLDVETVHAVWRNQKQVRDASRAQTAVRTVGQSIKDKMIFGEMEDTVLHMREVYSLSPLGRTFNSSQWTESGGPDPLADAEQYAAELCAKSDYAPEEDKLGRIVDVYQKACRLFGVQPLKLD